MPPAEKVTREDVVLAAVSVVDKEGLAALTARRVAQELGVSTAPVYRQFASMRELAAAVMHRARELLLESTAQPYTDRPFLNMGTGIALFAKQHPRLYRALFLETDEFHSIVKGFLDELTENMRNDPRFASMDRKRRAQLLDRMFTYTHGLASLVAVGLARHTSKAAIMESLSTVGGAVIRDALAS